MDNELSQQLKNIYKRYGFEIAKIYEQENVIVFTIKTGYFDNADIVPLGAIADSGAAFKEFSDLGYACTVRHFLTPIQTEQQLFKGFFSVESILTRLESDYQKFTKNIVTPFSDDAAYEYINTSYSINGKVGETSPAQEVLVRLAENKPKLFLIEAAAGFGKTCTAYELVHLLKQDTEYLPLFAELSRNRKAAVFRYILLDEIDLKFPGLNSKLVQGEMLNGKVITVLDGFDELLRKSEDTDDFQNREPMLETIGQFLTGNAKIVLTTRRTVLFEGDAFHEWVAKHADDFELVRIKLNEPTVSDWLKPDRMDAVKNSNLEIINLANPVLLSYLRWIPDKEFSEVMQAPENLVDKYFEFMLERERVRQDLRMDIATQQRVLLSIADDMIAYSYTSEKREYIVDLIQKSNGKVLDEVLAYYPGAERPDKEGLANKIASHALLDRSAQEPNKIGFINEFVFGHFIAKNIFAAKEWLNDDLRFIEPAVISYKPRKQEQREKLLMKLKDSMEFLTITDRFDLSKNLDHTINFDLADGEIEGLEIDHVKIGSNHVRNFQFNECSFVDCEFDMERFQQVTFLNCRFYRNKFSNNCSIGPVHVLAAIGDQEFIKSLSTAYQVDVQVQPPERQDLAERYVLEKFWPIGKDMLMHKHRPIKGLCAGGAGFRSEELYDAIQSLKKKGILLSPMQVSFVEVNFEMMSVIKKVLER